MKRVLVMVLWMCGSLNLLALEVIPDTVKVEEVMITANRGEFYREDYKSFKTDSTLKELLGHENVQDVLQFMAPVQIMCNGSAGALTGIKLRGGSGSHTQVNWNGFPVNSLTAGSADLSMFSFNMGDEITLIYGGSGSLYGSGAVDGVVNVQSNPRFENKTRLGVSYEGGSFSHLALNAKLEKGTEKIHLSIALSGLNALNDFPYLDTRNRERTCDHNAVRAMGVIPYLHYKTENSGVFGIGAMYYAKTKELPVKMNSVPGSVGTQVQRDSTFKVFGRWDYIGQGYSIQCKSALFNDYLKYSEEGSDNSNINSRRFYNDVNLRLFPSTALSLDLGAQYSLLQGEVTAYGEEPITEHDGALIFVGKYRNDKVVINGSGRLAFNSQYSVIPVGALGGKYMLIENLLAARVQLATRYRQPTFNDRYWQPYGNPDLNPEKGYNVEVGFNGSYRVGKHHLKYDATGYFSRINDWIQWVPTDEVGGMAPLNYTSVESSGCEISVSDNINFKNGFFRLQGHYNYNRTINAAEQSSNYNKFMTYMPRHKTSFGAVWGYGQKLWIMANGNFVGDRYTTEDNDAFHKMDPYMTLNAKMKYKYVFNKIVLGVFVKIDNLLDQRYQVIELYQMPGRSTYFGLEINFKS